jgi:hypothetical protein
VTTAPLPLVAGVVMLDGTPVIVGGVRTTTLKVLVDERMALSVAVQLTVVVPSGKDAPEAGVQVFAVIVTVPPPPTAAPTV